MARKRISEPEIAVSNSAAGAAPARRKPAVTRKHTPATSVAEPLSEARSVSSVPAAPPAFQPTHEDIAALAYSYWVARGYQFGSPEEDWLRAERELTLATVAAGA